MTKTKTSSSNKKGTGERILLDVAQLEFVDGGNTIWIHGPKGNTVLRIKTMGKVRSVTCLASKLAHGDIMVNDDIEICH